MTAGVRSAGAGGGTRSRASGEARWRSAALAALLVSALSAAVRAEPAGPSRAPAAPGEESLPVDASSLSASELDSLCRQLDDEDEASRRAAAERIVDSAPTSVEAIRQRLVRDLRAAPAEMLAVLDRSNRDEPGQRFPQRDREPFDMVEALVAAPRPEQEAERRALREASEVVVLLRALAETGASAAAGVVIRYGVRERGVFRAEVGRNLLRLGDRAIPSLVRAARHPTPEVAAFAAEALEWLGRSSAGRQVQVRDPAVLAELLGLFGESGNRDLVPVLLSFTGADNSHVREAARAGVTRFGRAAIWPIREKYASFTGQEPDRSWSADELARRLFEAQDRARLAQAQEQMDRGLAHAAAGEHDAMLRVYRTVLARWPLYDRRHEMVPGLVAAAEGRLAAGERAEARALLTEAGLLAVDDHEATLLRARVALLEAEDGLARGVADLEAVDRLLALAPESAPARALRAEVARRTELPAPRTYRTVAAVGLSLFGLACLGLLVVRRLPPPPKRREPALEPGAPGSDEAGPRPKPSS